MNKRYLTRKAKRKAKAFIDESLRQFLLPVSRMGGSNPVDWEWGDRSKRVTQEGQIRKVA